ncbi:uracil-DNA glycosylase [Howardella ureilytica]
MSDELKTWGAALKEEFEKPYFRELYNFVISEYEKDIPIYPPKKDILNALRTTPLDKVKVVILGQDPYHNEGQAHGLSFSVNKGVAVPPSLVNIYHELQEDVGCYIPNNGDLTKWAKQGVLLLNTVLTVRAHEPFSHKGIGWERFTDSIIKILDESDRPICFMLWGSPAKKKMSMLTNKNHLVLTASHPSPMSSYRGFFGCKHFSKANEYLISHGEEPIDWQIENI